MGARSVSCSSWPSGEGGFGAVVCTPRHRNSLVSRSGAGFLMFRGGITSPLALISLAMVQGSQGLQLSKVVSWKQMGCRKRDRGRCSDLCFLERQEGRCRSYINALQHPALLTNIGHQTLQHLGLDASSRATAETTDNRNMQETHQLQDSDAADTRRPAVHKSLLLLYLPCRPHVQATEAARSRTSPP